jgi:hypothetical protein
MPLSRASRIRAVTLGRVRIEDVDAVATSLPGVRRSGRPGRLTWRVGGRLVVREDVPGTLVVRVGLADRERLLAQHPETFGVPPHFEKHLKMQVDLDGDAGAIRDAIRLAWSLQVEE